MAAFLESVRAFVPSVSSMKVLSSISIATAIAIFFKFDFPPFLSEIFFVLVILVMTYAAVSAAKTNITTRQISAAEQPESSSSATSSGGSGLRFLRRLDSNPGGYLYVAEIRPWEGLFAAKVMDKSTQNREARARTEMQILKMLDHPFLPKLHTSIDSDTDLCLLTEFCPAGNLNDHRQSLLLKRFSEPAVRFYAAEVVVALEYLHMMGIIHRDLKPENVLIKRDGHIMLTNFQLSLKCEGVVSTHVTPESNPKKAKRSGATRLIPSCFRPMKRQPKKNKPAKFQFTEFVAEPCEARSNSFVGTHEFMAPEMVNQEEDGHGSAVDWWALGIFIYEMFYGETPFKGLDESHTMNNIAVKYPMFPSEPAVSEAAVDLMTQLLTKDASDRLGSTAGASVVKSHPFFRGVNWALLRSTAPPYVPHPSVNNYCYDQSYGGDDSSYSSIEFF